ncbi:TetR/AcrR family transcriptional regulator [Catellatospora sp. NPDC049111]|uniref:TetR/AcrR family transcriptional regulator n=1 Tax=Catellatospora sp. NPDC049111 TaxID=3155271 RepID=UPI0034022D42
MAKSSRAEAMRHREDVVNAASRLLRERGPAGLSVQDLMAAAGLTHGGFYKHFSSKDQLMGIAATSAFGEILTLMVAIRAEAPDVAQARSALLSRYLSVESRDAPGEGCANAALASDAARSAPDSPLRESYVAGVAQTIGQLAAYQDAPGRDPQEARRAAITDFAAMVGALVLSRATSGSDLSDEILQVVRQALIESPRG